MAIRGRLGEASGARSGGGIVNASPRAPIDVLDDTARFRAGDAAAFDRLAMGFTGGAPCGASTFEAIGLRREGNG